MGRLNSLLVLIPLCAVALPAQAGSPCARYASELAVMVGAADTVRSRVDYLAPPGDRTAARHRDQLLLVERDNASRLATLMSVCGWPRLSVEGAGAARDAWLVAQAHGDDVPFQRQVVRQLELAVLDGEASGHHLALASDRLAVREGRAQRYGTQLHQVDGCSWDYYRLDDPERVEARRKRLDLPPLEAYRRSINDMVIKENCPGPALAARPKAK